MIMRIATEQAALSAMEQLASDATSKRLTREVLQIESPFLEYDLNDVKPVSSKSALPSFDSSTTSKRR